jgi:acyl carrier protein
VAYLRSRLELDPNDIRERLYVSLPQYMVPAAFMFMDEMPLTPNGKVDRKQLPAPEWTAQNEYVAPRTEMEQRLAIIWQNVLRIEQIGVQDNFFVLGGHSLLATQLIARIRQEFQLELPLMYIFDYPSIESLSVSIEAFRLANDSSDHGIDDENMEDISI